MYNISTIVKQRIFNKNKEVNNATSKVNNLNYILLVCFIISVTDISKLKIK